MNQRDNNDPKFGGDTKNSAKQQARQSSPCSASVENSGTVPEDFGWEMHLKAEAQNAKTRAEEAERKLNEKDRELASKQSELEKERNRSVWLQNEWNAAKANNDELSRTSELWWTVAYGLNCELESIYGSKVWQLTRPLRKAAQGLVWIRKTLLNLAQLPKKVVRKRGSIPEPTPSLQHSDNSAEFISTLTPRARQIYTELKSAIEKKQGSIK